MGRRKQRRKQFLTDNPACCFCGGTRTSEEPDHVPGRAFFDGRAWPEGFIFPACVRCNRETSVAEQGVSTLAYLSDELAGDIATQKLTELKRHNPEFFADIHVPGASEARRILREMGYRKPIDVSTDDIPMVRLGQHIENAIYLFGRKLMLALYYKHTEKILSRDGGMTLRWITNAVDETAWDRIMESVSRLSGSPPLVRANRYLDNQFAYRYALVPSPHSESELVAAFFVWFRRSFGLLGIVSEHTDLAVFERDMIVRPFSWDD